MCVCVHIYISNTILCVLTHTHTHSADLHKYHIRLHMVSHNSLDMTITKHQAAPFLVLRPRAPTPPPSPSHQAVFHSNVSKIQI